MADVTIKVLENGPILVTGPVTLIDHNEEPVPLIKESIALCRCGNSSKKPFCDGTHKSAGFQGTLYCHKAVDAPATDSP